ncbi:MAG: indolepyruvate ferredoxin oxidoreductase family protein [Pseudomonadales bacterium]
MATVESPPCLDDYQLKDRYRRDQGRVFLTGTQTLVRLPLVQRELDRRNGLNTAGYITGYRGSPLGSYDLELWKAREFLEAECVEFLPAINEDLAATAVIGTQQVEGDPDKEVDGVFSIWYGKGPGVDRAGDAMKHGNAYGSSPTGGVLVVAGDDHGCVSSSMSHQSDVAFMSWFMPTLNPASVAEYIDFGLYGFALSRFSGTWVGFKAISETVESAASVELNSLPAFRVPENFEAPESGLHYRWPDFPGPQVEARMLGKLDAVRAFARANPIDRRIYDIADARMGIITTGKGHLDLMEALDLLGVDEHRARTIGIDIYKIGMVWPIETEGARAFLRGKEEVLVVEEKRGIIESELKEFLYDYPGDKPRRMVGKYDESGHALVPWVGELSPTLLAPLVAARITHEFPDVSFEQELIRLQNTGVTVTEFEGVKRLPYFCSGCPYNTSTKVPEGSKALAGIGCHFMASWMDRDTESLIQMGGEGVNWVGKSRFIGNKHIFQNLGEGTYFHSGYMAIRQAQAAATNITYKILFNDAVAMTGGQPVDGTISVPAIANQVRAEGVSRIAVVSDEPEKYRDKSQFPAATTFHHRDDMDALQREFRDVKGVSVLIYDQTCAAEKRRLRKRNAYPDPAKRVFINELVCEGCGDCSEQSNCLSIYPVDTEFGRKRKIDQSSCNKDYSCVKGFCPSFVTVVGGELRRPDALTLDSDFDEHVAQLPEPQIKPLEKTYDLLVGGVGGTGVVTVGALITMAAHLEGKGASVLDFTGFAQKGGSVLSYVRLGQSPAVLNQVRIDHGMADTVIACDIVVGTDPRAIKVLRHGHTQVIVNAAEIPSGDFVLDRNADMATEQRIALLQQAVGVDRVETIAANTIAENLMGHSVYSNVFLLGNAWQKGLVPLSLAALLRAIELNGVAVEQNKQAFDWGRLAAGKLDYVILHSGLQQTADAPPNIDIEHLVARRCAFLTEYQDAAYAKRYESFVHRVSEAESQLGIDDKPLTTAVAKYLFKLMAYKDEYEVARLYTEGTFTNKLQETFSGDYRLTFNMAPPLLARKKDHLGRPKKITLGPWMLPLFKLLAKGKVIRGKRFDPFGQSQERKTERGLIAAYERTLGEILPSLNQQNHAIAVTIAGVPDQVRGYGPVKDESIAQAQQRSNELLVEFRSPASTVNIVEAA